jgi:hypothetical protein
VDHLTVRDASLRDALHREVEWVRALPYFFKCLFRKSTKRGQAAFAEASW